MDKTEQSSSACDHLEHYYNSKRVFKYRTTKKTTLDDEMSLNYVYTKILESIQNPISVQNL